MVKFWQIYEQSLFDEPYDCFRSCIMGQLVNGCCCCFSLTTGTNIIAAFTLVGKGCSKIYCKNLRRHGICTDLETSSWNKGMFKNAKFFLDSRIVRGLATNPRLLRCILRWIEGQKLKGTVSQFYIYAYRDQRPGNIPIWSNNFLAPYSKKLIQFPMRQ